MATCLAKPKSTPVGVVASLVSFIRNACADKAGTGHVKRASALSLTSARYGAAMPIATLGNGLATASRYVKASAWRASSKCLLCVARRTVVMLTTFLTLARAARPLPVFQAGFRVHPSLMSPGIVIS